MQASENTVVETIGNSEALKKGIEMSENNLWVSRVVAWSGKAALVCLGLFAMLALVVLVAVLAPVMLTATVIPPTRRDGREIRETGDTTVLPETFSPARN